MAASSSIVASQDTACGPLENAYGPFDYRFERGERLRLVESAHFGPLIEALVRGKAENSRPGPDIDYTLRAFPNHHRALVSTVKLGERHGVNQPPGMRYTVECWLLRAVRFRPQDAIVRMIYAQFLLKNNRSADALVHLKEAEAYAGDDPFTHYNIGMIFMEAGALDAALRQAHRALELGFTRMDLKDQLVKAGRWIDPEGTDRAPRVAPPGRDSTPASEPQRH